MKILLDIDGVMVHAIPNKRVEVDEDGYYKFNEKAINKLNSLIGEGDEIMLTTSHRFQYSTAEWGKLFEKRGIKAVKISFLPYILGTYNRRSEIERWIDREDVKPEDILIIDDDKSLNGLSEEFKERLMLTDPYIGLVFQENRMRGLTFEERSILGIEELKKQPPVTLEMARAQAQRLRDNSTSENKKGDNSGCSSVG